MKIYEFISENWIMVMVVIGIAQLIVKITPSKKDDRIFSKYFLRPLNRICEYISMNRRPDFKGFISSIQKQKRKKRKR